MRTLDLGPELELPLSDVIGQCIAILGIRGSGKSNTAGVIFEELLSARYPLAIVDADGEYFGLKERYEVLVVGEGDNVDIELGPDAAAGVAELSLREGVPVVLDVSGMLSEERELFVLAYLSRIWALAGMLRRPYMIGIEECHEFIPQGVRTDLGEVVARIALRGRKRGLGAVIISQRSAKVEKDVLTQAGMLFLHRVVHEADMRVYGELLPWPRAEVREQVAGLEVGECIFLGDHTVRRVGIRPRRTFHGGFTPSFQPVETPKLRQVREEILAAVALGAPRGMPRREAPLSAGARSGPRARTQCPRVVSALRPDHELRPTPVLPPAVPPSRDGELPKEVLHQVERLLRRLHHRPLHEQRLVAFLVSREPRTYTTAELAQWIDCAEPVLLAEPPAEPVEMGLLLRERFARGITYRACLKPYVYQTFAGFLGDLGREGTHRLVAHLRGRLAELPTTERNFDHIG
jgi:hypothetical protein